jgi:hypothetical protein
MLFNLDCLKLTPVHQWKFWLYKHQCEEEIFYKNKEEIWFSEAATGELQVYLELRPKLQSEQL